MDNKHGIEIHWKWFWLNLGWYPGDPFRLFSLILFEPMGYPVGTVDFLTVFDIQVIHFSFLFGWRKHD